MSQVPRQDVENPSEKPREYLDGFPSFAAFIASDKDLAIYRRFDRLSARNLLYLQSEIIALEAELDELDGDDFNAARTRDLDVMQSARCWEAMVRGSAVFDSRDAARMELIRKLRGLMKEYRRCLSDN